MKCEKCGTDIGSPHPKAARTRWCKKCAVKYDKLSKQISRCRDAISTFIVLELIKEELECVNCGIKPHPVVLEFHHEHGKERNVATFAAMGRMDAMLIEIQKCKPLCANCHKEVHYVDSRYRVWKRWSENSNMD